LRRTTVERYDKCRTRTDISVALASGSAEARMDPAFLNLNCFGLCRAQAEGVRSFRC
jgi:hypothetical protein